ncbi:MAG: DNA mismatch repair protein MutS, partial [Candidatus Dadabacteria bacterium]
PYYIARQKVSTGERFITEELKEQEGKIFTAEEKIKEREKFLYQELINFLSPYSSVIRALASPVAEIDVLQSLAETAVKEGLVKPGITEDLEIKITEGKHPILTLIKPDSVVPNSFYCGAKKRFFVLTGPNMGGKSTFLRQNALIIIMAQIGSFVPAKEAEIGVVDKIFARIGASDNLFQGESTFMVEMQEASRILSNATAKSFVLIDEIGRGTATADGEAIAEAISEWLIKVTKCRTLFATHFHELTRLEKKHSYVANLCVEAVVKDDEIMFTHKVIEGAGGVSYGILVAKLASLPKEIILKASEILRENERKLKRLKKDKTRPLELPVFLVQQQAKTQENRNEIKKVVEKLKEININNTTPINALQILSELKELVEKK